MKKTSLTAALLATLLIAAPAFADEAHDNMDHNAPATHAPMKAPMKKTMHKAPMHRASTSHHVTHRKMACSDYAWQSQEAKDCEAHSGH